jgi:hypothetical protein
MTANTKKCWRVDLRILPARGLLFWCLEQQSVDRMLVVVRMEQQGNRYLTPRELKQLPKSLFGRNVLDDFRASEWPGTKLIGHPGYVSLVKFDQSIAEVILRIEPELNKWLYPSNRPLPEDICLFNSSADTPTLVSVTHENLYWIIAEQKPKLATVRESKTRPEELYSPGKYFCQPWTKRK